MSPNIKEPICFSCKNYIYWPYCMAFPDGIPKKIRDGKDNHKKNIRGDHGIKYEKREKKEK